MNTLSSLRHSPVLHLAVIVTLLMTLMASPAHATIATATLAPDFTLHSIAGSNQRLLEQRGKVVMINFWATWCGPCRQEMPQLNKLYEKYRSAGFVLLGINIDQNSLQATEVAHKLGVTFPVLFDADKTVSHLYDLDPMPTTVIIDRNGRVRYVHDGYRAGYEDLYEKEIRELLK